MTAPWPFTQEAWDERKAHEGESTSARLRRIEQERDELAVKLSGARDRVAQLERLAATALMRETADVVAELASARAELAALRAANDQLRDDYAEAADELERLRYSGWIVARAPLGRGCAACAREVQRGQAYSTDTTRDELRHVHCPTEGES